MRVDLTLKNYRCFPDSHPARLTLREGFTAFVGPNNSGKSFLMKFFYEFRSLLEILSQPSGQLAEAIRGAGVAFNLGVVDISEVFSNESPRPLEIDITVYPDAATQPYAVTHLVVEVARGQNVFTVSQLQNSRGDVART